MARHYGKSLAKNHFPRKCYSNDAQTISFLLKGPGHNPKVNAGQSSKSMASLSSRVKSHPKEVQSHLEYKQFLWSGLICDISGAVGDPDLSG